MSAAAWMETTARVETRDASSVDWTRVMREARRFGVQTFRPGQRELIEAVLGGRDAIGVMPTGGGKSLCYQLPALLLPKPTVVVSPLLSLVQDQVAHLDGWRLDQTGISPLIYVTPERLQTEDCLALLRRNGVSRLVVDEAHCVSEWGHDFRPAYLGIARAARTLGRPPILAVTATATAETTRDLGEQLGLRAPVVVRPGLARPNLAYRVVRTVNDDRKREALRALLAGAPGCGIVYVATTALAEEVHAWLLGEGVAAGLYHGKRPMRERVETQARFMAGALRVMVATKAFGLGVDKPDVRFVAHWTFPDSLESYVQESGRAGRDGQRAQAVLLYRLEDKRIQTYFLGGRYPRPSECQRLCAALPRVGARVDAEALAAAVQMPLRRLRVVLAHLERDGLVRVHDDAIEIVNPKDAAKELGAVVARYERRRTGDRERLDAMMHYAQSLECRAVQLLRYFGERAAPCGVCDACGGAS